MSSDFDKSDVRGGIDFHEAERLSVEHFAKTYPEFIALFNSKIREAINRGAWILDLDWWNGGNWNAAHQGTPEKGPLKNDALGYLKKLGFDISHPNSSTLRVNWTRRDGGKYP